MYYAVVYITLYLNHGSIKKKKKSKFFYFKLRKKRIPIELTDWLICIFTLFAIHSSKSRGIVGSPTEILIH